MAPRKRTKPSETGSLIKSSSSPKYSLAKLYRFVTKELLTLRIFTERTHFQIVSYFLLFLEIFMNFSIVNRIKYTEIDWSTYMQQVECFINGTLDYENISGDTGPIVYPAGHLYIYTILYYLTEKGTNIYIAQHFFIVLYLATLFIVFRIYQKFSNIPPYVLIFMCCTSYRVHSIYLLRLFNDPIAMFTLYTSLYFMANQKWTIGCMLFSLAVSIKMNVLLFAPALFLVLMEHNSVFDVFKKISICATIQVLIGLPFLVTYPISYIKSSFNLGRVFLHKWTVNYRFLPEDVFTNSHFHGLLLLFHLVTLLVIFRKRWLYLIQKVFYGKPINNTPDGKNILLTMFTANLIGMAYARSLHYQFYVWYYHSLAFLLWNTKYNATTKICILGLIELVWNIYPSTVWSSSLLHFLHLSILIALSGHVALSTTVDKAK